MHLKRRTNLRQQYQPQNAVYFLFRTSESNISLSRADRTWIGDDASSEYRCFPSFTSHSIAVPSLPPDLTFGAPTSPIRLSKCNCKQVVSTADHWLPSLKELRHGHNYSSTIISRGSDLNAIVRPLKRSVASQQTRRASHPARSSTRTAGPSGQRGCTAACSCSGSTPSPACPSRTTR